MTNYTLIDNNLITNLKISDGAYRCYNLLSSLCYAQKISCYPSISYLACALGRSCRTINRYIKELIKNNLISKRRRGSISNLYVLLHKKAQQTIEKVKDTVQRAKNTYTSQKTYLETKKDTFNNYNQRNYNFDKLEDLLLNGKGNYKDCLLE